MKNIDLITVIHPEDKRVPKFKYTFKAPANSGIKSGDYVIVDIKGREVLGAVISVLENINEQSSLMNYIRTVSTIKDQKLKPISYKLVKVALVDATDDDDNNKNTDSSIAIGTNYFSIEQGMTGGRFACSREYYLYLAEYTYCDCNWDIMRIEEGNIFSNKEEGNKIIEAIMKNVTDRTKLIDVKKELKKIL